MNNNQFIRLQAFRAAFICVIYLLLPLCASAAWYDPGWGYRKKITVQAGRVPGTLSDFPMLINSTDPDWRDTANGGKVGQPDGGDILFTSSDGTTKLPHEIEEYDNAGGRLVAWVKVPSVSDGTVIYMYYGNPSAADQWDTEDTWDDNYVMVQHLQETSGVHFDSASNGNNGSPYGGVNQNAAGQIGGADSFDGSGDYLAIRNLNYTTRGGISALTVCVWFNTSFGGSGWVSNWALVDFDRSEYYNFFVYGDTGELGFATSANGIVDMRGNTPANDGRWHYGCIVFDSTSDNSNHWSTTSGGSPGATMPGTGSTVIFDINSGGGTCILDGNVSVAGFDMQSGNTTAVDTGTGDYALTVSGSFTVTAGYFSANGSTVTVGGDWTNNGTFTPGTGTVVLNGADQGINGSTTFYNLIKSVTGAATLTFDDTGVQTITNNLVLKGSGSGLLSLRSKTRGRQWHIDPQGARDISYVDVRDSNNINTTWISAVNSEGSGNNTGWYFGNHMADIDSDGTEESAMDADDDSANGYEAFTDPDCPAPRPGRICSSVVLSMDGDRDHRTDHFIDTNGDAIPDKLWDPDEYIIQDVELMDINRDGSDEWVYDADGNGSLDFAYNPAGSRFIDPFGTVFDSVTNNEIAGAVVTIYRASTGMPAVPGADLAAGDVNPVITGANGTYGFNTAPGDYYITVTAAGYTYPFEPSSRTFDAGRTICVDNPAAGYPSAACEGQYGSRGETFSVSTVITMDHPLDPTHNLIKLTKKANKTEAATGEIITYTITIESMTTTDLTPE
ncbi:MAG: DUF2341 domain-containing protein [Deferribacteres bacterium]|nr:DUF2341 domain-containing protein [Deferribacteres bacterium]